MPGGRKAPLDQRYRARKKEDEEELIKDTLELSRTHPRFGTQRITARLRRDGWRVNTKPVQRLRRKLGLKVPRKQHKKRQLGSSANSCTRRRAERRNHVWSYDFVFDRTEDGRRLKFLTVVDEYTRESLAIEVGRRFTAVAVIAVLARLVAERGAPEFVRSDNGPEFIAAAVRAWLTSAHSSTAFVAPGAPLENAYIETFNGKLADELLEREMFFTLAEARQLAAEYHRELQPRATSLGARLHDPCGVRDRVCAWRFCRGAWVLGTVVTAGVGAGSMVGVAERNECGEGSM